MKIKQYIKLNILSLLAYSTVSYAEIIPDNTLGSEVSLTDSDYQITAGQQHGENLFHSFSQFNLDKSESATFSGLDSVRNIISRVTGGESTINGTIRSTIAGANMYLLNPAGITFGDGAKLDIDGSFHASTADYLSFADGGIFYATNSGASLLTVAPPSAFGFLGSPADISIESSNLSVPDNRSLSIMGGDIEIKDSDVFASDGSIHIASVASKGEVKVMPHGDNLAHFAQLGEIGISNSKIGNDTHKPKNGSQDIYIRGGNLYLSNNSVLNARVRQEKSNNATGIVIDIRDSMTLKNDGTIISTDTFSDADANNITIRTQHLMMQDNVVISSASGHQDSGAAGTITIDVSDIAMTDNASIGSNTSGGLGGQVNISASGFIEMTGAAHINAISRGTDKAAGKVKLKAADIVMFDKAIINLGTYTSSEPESGEGGQAVIEATTIFMTDQAKILSSSFDSAQSGNIEIKVDNLILTGESAIGSTTFSAGKGGKIAIYVNNVLALAEKAALNSGTEGSGSGGSLTVTAKHLIVNNASITSGSGVKDAFTENIADLIERAIELGAQGDEQIFKGGGQAGTIDIEAKNKPSENIFILPQTLSKIAEPQLMHCGNQNDEGLFTLTIGGRAGLSTQPGDLM